MPSGFPILGSGFVGGTNAMAGPGFGMLSGPITDTLSGSAGRGIGWHPNGKFAFIGTGRFVSIVEFDPSENGAFGARVDGDTLPVPSARGLNAQWHPDGGWLLVADEEFDTAPGYKWSFNDETGALGSRSTLFGLSDERGFAVHFHPDGGWVLLASSAGLRIAEFDPSDGSTSNVTLYGDIASGWIHGARFTPDGNWVIYADRDADTIVARSFDPQTGALGSAQPNSPTIGRRPRGVEIAPDGSAAASCSLDDNVAVAVAFDNGTWGARDTKTVGDCRSIAWSKDSKTLFALPSDGLNPVPLHAYKWDGAELGDQFLSPERGLAISSAMQMVAYHPTHNIAGWTHGEVDNDQPATAIRWLPG